MKKVLELVTISNRLSLIIRSLQQNIEVEPTGHMTVM